MNCMTKMGGSRFLFLAKRSLRTLRNEGPDRLFLYGTRYLSWKLQFHSLVRSLPNPIATAVYRLTKGIVRRTIRLLNRIYPHKYTEADPYKRIFVDPSTIEYTSSASRRRGWVVDGEWHEKGSPFVDRTVPRAIKQRFVDGLEWDETVLADKFDGQQLEEQAEGIERLYHHIRESGYKSQRQLLEEDPEAAWDGLNDAMHPLANEIAVDIGPGGKILWSMCGQHRLAITKVLGIDQIPVQVMRRHADWQAVREEVRQGNQAVVEPHCDHPDLRDLIEESGS